MKLNKNNVALLLVILAGFILRLYHINAQSFWLDECISVNMAKLDLRDLLLVKYASFHPPFYYLILHFWVRLVGDAETATRMLSLVFGVISIFAIYKLASRIFDKKAGLYSALIIAMSAFHIRYSQETRMYALAVLLALASFYFFVGFYRKNSRASALGWVISTALLLYTHFSAFLVLLAQNIYVFTERFLHKEPGELRPGKWLALQGAALVLFLPFFGIWMSHLAFIQNSPFWLNKPTAETILAAFSTFAGSITLLALYLVLAAFSFTAGVGYLLIDWLVAPHAILLAMASVSSSLYAAKYLIVASPALYILAGRGTALIRRPVIKAAAISAIVIFSLVSAGNYYLNFQKPQWRQAVAFMSGLIKPGDLIAFNDKTSKDAIFDRYYYKNRAGINEICFPGTYTTVPYVIPTPDNAQNLFKECRSNDRVWIVLSHVRDGAGNLIKVFTGSYKLVKYRRFNVLEIYLFEKK